MVAEFSAVSNWVVAAGFSVVSTKTLTGAGTDAVAVADVLHVGERPEGLRLRPGPAVVAAVSPRVIEMLRALSTLRHRGGVGVLATEEPRHKGSVGENAYLLRLAHWQDINLHKARPQCSWPG